MPLRVSLTRYGARSPPWYIVNGPQENASNLGLVGHDGRRDGSWDFGLAWHLITVFGDCDTGDGRYCFFANFIILGGEFVLCAIHSCALPGVAGELVLLAPVDSGAGRCNDADMDSSPVADNGGPVATEAGCNAVVLVEPGVWVSPNVGTSSIATIFEVGRAAGKICRLGRRPCCCHMYGSTKR